VREYLHRRDRQVQAAAGLRVLTTDVVSIRRAQMLHCWLVLTAAFLFASTGHPQQVAVPEKMLGTTYVTSEPTYGSGVLLGCGLS
jgi:hypothetical protein